MFAAHGRSAHRAFASIFFYAALIAPLGNLASAQQPERIANVEPALAFQFGNGITLGSRTVYSGFVQGTSFGNLFVDDGSLDNFAPFGYVVSGVFTKLGTSVVFDGAPVTGNQGLWRTDGTGAGTVKLAEPPHLVAKRKGLLFFSRPKAISSNPITEWWRTDGTVAGTRQIAATPDVTNAVAASDTSLFYVRSEAGPGANPNLVALDLATGTTLVLTPFSTSDGPRIMQATGSHVFAFSASASVPASYSLLTSDGTPAGTVELLSSTLPQSPSLVTDANYAYFPWCTTQGCDLWASDGTASGTGIAVAKPGATSASEISLPLKVGENAYLVTTVGSVLTINRLHGRTVTPLLSGRPDSLSPALAGESVGSFGDSVEALYLCVPTGGGAETTWRTDGTAVGTQQVYPVCFLPGKRMVVSGSRVVYEASRSIGIPRNTLAEVNLANGEYRVVSGTPSLSSVLGESTTRPDGKAVFTACNIAQGCEPWVSDGTQSGTRLLADLVPAGSGAPQVESSPGSQPFGFTHVENQTYFYVTDGFQRSGIGVTDGTPTGTRVIRWIGNQLLSPLGSYLPEPRSSNVFFKALGGLVYFVACPDVGNCGVWSTDGTEAGTQLVAPLPLALGTVSEVSLVNGRLVFLACTNNTGDCRAYSSAGTGASTLDLGNATPGVFAEFDGNFYFSNGVLRRTNGLPSGTVDATDMLPTGLGTIAHIVALPNELLVFRKISNRSGLESVTVTSAAPGRAPKEIGGDTSLSPIAFLRAGGNLIYTDVQKLNGTSINSSTLKAYDSTRGTIRTITNDISSDPVLVGNSVAFTKCTQLAGCELWRTSADGFGAAVFARVRGTNEAGELSIAYVASGSRLLFTSDDGKGDGNELWAVEVPQPVSADDSDGDGIPDSVEITEGTNPFAKDNDVFSSNRLFVMQQYRDLLRREATPAEVSTGIAALTAGQSKAAFIEAFIKSPPYEDLAGPVIRLYSAYFLRKPDMGGYHFWVDAYRVNNPWTFIGISNFFVISDEFKQRYGSLTNDQFVTLIYRNILNRAPDAGGFAFWTDELNSGRRNAGQVMADFSESPENKLATRGAVRVFAATATTSKRGPTQVEIDSWQPVIQAGGSFAAFVDTLIASPEYRSRFMP